MGLWHAGWPLNWLAWGMWHGVGMVVVLMWARYAQKRRITFFKSTAGHLAGWAMTMIFVALGGAFTTLHARAPLYDSIRLMAKAVGLDI
jgi:D-alanyl-lipoteichoic acid acyltransferase DltB (MBOAT superfamily)